MSRKRCVVIGAGLAGLAAAHRLLQKNWNVVVLEAENDRLGGRVLTQRVPLNASGKRKHERQRKGKQREEQKGKPDELVYELGGEWIGTSHKRMIQLCEEFGLHRMQHRFSFAFLEAGKLSPFYGPGQLPFSRTENDAIANYLKVAKGLHEGEQAELDQIDWWTKVKELGFSTKALLRRDLMDSTDFGESIRHTSAFVGMTEYACGNKTDEMDTKIVGGNDQLIYAFARAIDDDDEGEIKKAQEVSQIHQKNDGVLVLTRSGEEYRADACICAIPATQLHRIHWDPPLPPEQSWAARELQYARIVKTAFLFPQRFWPKFNDSGFSLFTSLASDFCFESTYGQVEKDSDPGIICSYAIGDKADDIADEPGPDLAEWLSKDLNKALGNQVAVKKSVAGKYLDRRAWQRESCIGGAYAFYRPGQWFHVRPTLQRPHQRVWFAGEHLSENWQGFMEGAVETGEAAADAL